MPRANALFPLNRADRLRGEIVENAVDAVDLVGDAVGNLVENGVGDLLDGGGHRVARVDGADDGGPALVSAAVLDAHALDVGHGDEVLPNLFGKTVLIELLAENGVCLAERI